MFFIRSSKIIVDCFTNNKGAYDYAPIDNASSFYPKWWKESNKKIDTDSGTALSIKHCAGIIDYYQHGFIIPMWTDLSIDVNENGYKWDFADKKSSAINHNYKQWEFYANPKEFGHLKINSAWFLKSKSNTQFAFVKPYWNFNPIEEISIPSGIVNYKHQYTTNINMFINLTKQQKILIPFGQPMIHLLPLTEKNIILKHHLISDEEFKNFYPLLKFEGNYNKIKSLNIKKEKKCPFGF